ncbi:MAG TPA: hypothetical protein VIE12_05190 [Actinomycetota bacterium]|jgi:hypothetical protein
MDHSHHRPGTVADCPACQLEAYEPGWYRALRAEHAAGRVESAEVSDATILTVEEASLSIYLPQLETA